MLSVWRGRTDTGLYLLSLLRSSPGLRSARSGLWGVCPHDPVASGVLGLVKRRVGTGQGRGRVWQDRTQAHAHGDSDGLALDEYIGAVVGLQFIQILMKYDKDGKLIGKEPGVECYPLTLEIVNLWPRVRPHWKRFRRRLCHNCPACAHLTEPRFMVCSGCGVARYCSEKCQREHWPRHQQDCLTCQWLEKLKSASEKADDAPR